ncbi:MULTISPECIES: rRNA biogenesis protein rrp5 [Bacillota]|jgi:hypothetical protein|uniref:rRNA biogenesis protein rrp5 n=1 Tax=Bacillota TaxID=1239 RepID=UPI0003FDFEB7|nr:MULTISPECIES: rRNA biogenesis protein rrp5 [Bacillota]HEM3178839.1 rRNA biogenesis protein rrp5 [Streptococcus suis 92-4172]
MSRVKLLLDVVSDLRSLADSVQAVADAIASNGPDEITKPEQPKPEKQSEEKQITLEEVRAVLAEKSHDGFTTEVRALLEKYGASKLSQIDPSKYAALLADAEGLK